MSNMQPIKIQIGSAVDWGLWPSKFLGHEDGTLMNGISTLIKETPERSFIPLAMWGYREKIAICLAGSHQTPDLPMP